MGLLKGLEILKAKAFIKYCIFEIRKIAVLSGQARISIPSSLGLQTFL